MVNGSQTYLPSLSYPREVYMIELANSSIKLVDTLMQVHLKHMETKYKRRFHEIQKKLEAENKRAVHLRVDSVIDDLNDQLVMLLDNFSQEIRGKGFQSKDL